MSRTPTSRQLWRLPNLLGLARIALTPVVVGLVLAGFPGSGLIAWAVFVVAALTDVIDGRVARARGEVSNLGVFLDLTADKVLVAAVLITMVQVQLVPAWMVAVILVRDLVVGGVRQAAASEQVVLSARGLGKAKTVTTLVAIGVLLLAFDAQTGGPVVGLGWGSMAQVIGGWLMFAAVPLALVSGLGYLRSAWPLLLGSDRPT